MTKWGQNRRVLVVSLFKQPPSLEQANVCSGESFFFHQPVFGESPLRLGGIILRATQGSLGLGSRYRDNVVPHLILGVG